MQGFSNICRSTNAIHHVNKLKKSHMIISIDVEASFYKIPHPFMVKTVQRVGTEETHLNIIKAIYNKATANIILSVEILKAFLRTAGIRQGCPL